MKVKISLLLTLFVFVACSSPAPTKKPVEQEPSLPIENSGYVPPLIDWDEGRVLIAQSIISAAPSQKNYDGWTTLGQDGIAINSRVEFWEMSDGTLRISIRKKDSQEWGSIYVTPEDGMLRVTSNYAYIDGAGGDFILLLVDVLRISTSSLHPSEFPLDELILDDLEFDVAIWHQAGQWSIKL